MPLFPGHRFLGPGNTLRNGDPVNEDDGIAKSHDEVYERATRHEDVFAADQASAALFLNNFRRTASMECREIDGNVLITGNQIQQTQSDTSLTQAPATPKCRCRCIRTLPSVQAEQEFERARADDDNATARGHLSSAPTRSPGAPPLPPRWDRCLDMRMNKKGNPGLK
ncbi:hypothetical protein MRX96_021437 [Rhipicephalus microplus]